MVNKIIIKKMHLSEIKETDLEAIFKLTSNKNVMKYILKGDAWDKEKTEKFIKYSLEEQKMPDNDRYHYYYTMIEKDAIIGIVGFFKEKDLNYHFRIFIDPEYQGKGFFSQTINLIKDKLLKLKNVDKIIGEVHSNNLKMNQIMRKKFYFDKISKRGKIQINTYFIFLRDYTYLFKSDYISDKVIDAVFKKRGNFRKFVQSDTNPDFLHLDGKHYYDKNNYNYKAILKNIVNDDKNAIIIKSQLVKTIGDKPFFMKTYIFEKDEKVKKIDINKIWILKPDKGFSGEGIQLTTSKGYKTIKLNPKFSTWSLQEYITNPYLIDERKFHFRVMFVFVPSFNGEEKMGFWFKKIPIYLANKKYVNGEYEDLDIHMSHYSEKEPPRYFEDLTLDKKDKTSIIIQLKTIMKCLLDNINAGCYPEDSIRCYEMFGVDLMIDDKINLKLIEVNSKLGLKEFVKDKYAFNKNLLEAELEITCDYFLPTKNKVNKDKCDFVKI